MTKSTMAATGALPVVFFAVALAAIGHAYPLYIALPDFSRYYSPNISLSGYAYMDNTTNSMTLTTGYQYQAGNGMMWTPFYSNDGSYFSTTFAVELLQCSSICGDGFTFGLATNMYLGSYGPQLGVGAPSLYVSFRTNQADATRMEVDIINELNQILGRTYLSFNPSGQLFNVFIDYDGYNFVLYVNQFGNSRPPAPVLSVSSVSLMYKYYYVGFTASTGSFYAERVRVRSWYFNQAPIYTTPTPTWYPSSTPTWYPSSTPTWYPSGSPTWYPSGSPTWYPSGSPTWYPSGSPTWYPSGSPTWYPTWYPSSTPTWYPTSWPTSWPNGTSWPTGTYWPTGTFFPNKTDIDPKKPLEVQMTDSCLPRACVSNELLPAFDMYREAICANSLHKQADCTGMPSPMLFVHMFWDREFSRAQVISLKSFVLSQDLKRTHLILWTILDKETLRQSAGDADELLQQPWITVKYVNAVDLLPEELGEFGQRVDKYIQTKLTGNDAAKLSDFVRLAALHKFGGIYVDMDTIFLRPLNQLALISPFAFRWSFHNDAVNTAVWGMPTAHPAARRMLETIANDLAYETTLTSASFKSFHPFKLSELMISLKVEMHTLSSYVVDPLALAFDGKEWANLIDYTPVSSRNWIDIFERDVVAIDSSVTVPDMARGAFQFHYHSNFRGLVVPGSYAALIENDYTVWIKAVMALAKASSA